MCLPISVVYTYLYYAIHSLSLLVSQCNVPIQVVCTVPDVMVGVIDYWKDALASSDSERRYQSQENKVSLTLTFFNLNFVNFCFLHHLLLKCVT